MTPEQEEKCKAIIVAMMMHDDFHSPIVGSYFYEDLLVQGKIVYRWDDNCPRCSTARGVAFKFKP